MTNQFKIALLSAGTNPDDWDNLSDIHINADVPVRPEWTFARFSGFVETDDGARKGTGLPKATWTFVAITEEHREILRGYCPEDQLSAEVYVMTPTNEIDLCGNEMVWIAASAQMKWIAVDEEKDAGVTMNFSIEFDMMVEV